MQHNILALCLSVQS